MKKTYSNYRTDMRIGDVVRFDGGMDIQITKSALSENFDSKVIEVISQAPRQELTWDWIKEHIEELPELQCWHGDSSCKINAATKEMFWLYGEKVNNCYYENFYTEPPLPELIELVEEPKFAPMPVIDWSKIDKKYNWVAIDEDSGVYPYGEKPILQHGQWESDINGRRIGNALGKIDYKNSLQQRPVEEDPWVEITPQTKVKMPCEAIFFGHKQKREETDFKSILRDIDVKNDSKYPFWPEIGYGLYAKCKVRKSSIIVDDVEDGVVRFWFYKTYIDSDVEKTTYAYTEKDFLERYSVKEYCPAEEVPEASKWVKI